MAAPPIGVVVNPNARQHRGDPAAVARLANALGARGLVEESRSEADLPRIASRLRAEGAAVIAISGGDGTAGAVLTAFRDVYGDAPLPAIALLRGGTMNTVANGLGIPRRAPHELLAALAVAHERGETVARPRATIDVGGRLGFLFGIGVFAAFLTEYYARGGGAPSPLTAARTLGAMAASVTVGGPLARALVAQVPVDLVVEGEPWPCPSDAGYMTIAAGTVAQVGLGFRPFPLADERDDAFHLLALHTAALATLRVLPRVHRGERLPPEAARDGLVRRAVLSPRRPPLRYMVDGELGESTAALVLSAGPRVLVLRPLTDRTPAW